MRYDEFIKMTDWKVCSKRLCIVSLHQIVNAGIRHIPFLNLQRKTCTNTSYNLKDFKNHAEYKSRSFSESIYLRMFCDKSSVFISLPVKTNNTWSLTGNNNIFNFS